MPVEKINFNEIIDKPPTKTKIKDKEPSFLPIKINYLAKEQNNRNLGEKGEQLVVDYEKMEINKRRKGKPC